ncbi:MAG: prevent-host-death protein [Lentisphaerae bacterium RIFOXYA12_FULL_48_11]|nr:MAG: prevent-host-death protein [Lentisphaerae bacterium RIFOXYA12_FULL_48_11]
MTTVTLTEFRSHASGMLSRAERGETIVIIRHGRPIAEVSPISSAVGGNPSWKRSALRLVAKGASLASAILAERNDESVS